MVSDNGYQSWDVPRYEVQQIMPADNVIAVFLLDDGRLMKRCVVAWGVYEVRNHTYQRPNAAMDAKWVKADEPRRMVSAMVLNVDEGELVHVQGYDNFLGCCKPQENAEEYFADTIAMLQKEKRSKGNLAALSGKK